MTTRTKIVVLIGVAVVTALIVIGTSSFSPTATHAPTIVSYVCSSGKSITAVYYEGKKTLSPNPGQPPVPSGSVALALSDGRTMTLPQTLSADGVRYANADESFVFWNKGNGAMVLESDQEKSYIGCIMVVPELSGQNLPRAYANNAEEFSLRLPNGYTINESYTYQELGPGKDISGIKFTIPTSTAVGTNLGSDTGMTVEKIPQTTDCTANLFLDQGQMSKTSTLVDGEVAYSVASSTGAGAGNRYAETVYALPGTNPCIAVRYFIHYSVIENYPAGAVREFDEQVLLAQFDSIRRTLTVR